MDSDFNPHPAAPLSDSPASAPLPGTPGPDTSPGSTTGQELAPQQEDPPWGFADVMALVLLALLGIIVFPIFAVAFAAVFEPGVPVKEIVKDVRILLAAQAATYGVVLLGMRMVVARRYDGPFARAVKWNWPERRWAAWLVGGVILAIVSQEALSLLPIPKSLPIDTYFRDAASAWAMAAFGTLLAPLVEELFFRGFFYPVAARAAGVAAGVAITAVLFTLIHSPQVAHSWAPLLVLFGVGLVLTLARALTGSVAAGLLVHVSYNTTLFAMVYIATDHFRHLERLQQ